MKATLIAVYACLFTLIPSLALANEENCNRVVAQLLLNYKGVAFKPLNAAPVKYVDSLDNGLIPGDWVVMLKANSKRPQVERLITNNEQLFGRIQKDERGRFFIQTMNFGKKARFDLPRDSKINVFEGSYVLIDVKKSKLNDGTKPYATISKVISTEQLENDEVHKHLISQYGVSTKHTDESIQQAKRLSSAARNYDSIIEEELVKGRKDLRGLPLRSIDNITTIDYDDMIHVEKHAKGFTLYVAISDVAHWIEKGTPLANEASKKNLTAYFDHTRYPLYPEDFEKHLSLMPNQDRLAMVVQIDLDKSGQRTGFDIYEAVVNNKKAWHYEQVNPLWEAYKQGEKTPFNLDFELYQLLHQRRKSDGASYFGRKGSEFGVEAQKLLRYSKQEESHELIAEFMIEANEVVGEFMKMNNLPGIYRAHDLVKSEDLEKIQNLAKNLGIPNIRQHTTMSEILQMAKNPIQHEILIAYVLRYTPPAYYTTNVDGHSTLASKTYMQFTSPIRRDSDTINHRIIKSFLNGQSNPYQMEELVNKAEYASAKIILEKRRERVNIQSQRMARLLESGQKNFKAKAYYVGSDFVNLRIEEFDIDISLNTRDLIKKGLRFDQEKFTFGKKGSQISVGSTVSVRLDKWDEFLGEATFSPLF